MSEPEELNFEICTTWDGHQLSHAGMKLRISSSLDGNGICLKWSSPHFSDPLPPLPVGSCPGLWNYEVLEFFFLDDSTQDYLEVEVGPAGHYLVLQLKGKRNLLHEGLKLHVQNLLSPESHEWNGSTFIPADYLPPNVTKFNAYAIHQEGAERHYEALYPAQPELFGEPDFHRLELFGHIDLTNLLGQKNGSTVPA